MNILFLCSSLEPGADGVGDYTRRLAGALIRQNYKAAIIAINDRRMQAEEWQGKQYNEGTAVPVLRLSANMPWKERMIQAKAFADGHKAEYISLQYVPFGYHLKGLPFNVGTRLKQIGLHARWHIMFHELTVKKEESAKFRLWGMLQEFIIRQMRRQLQPVSVSTNTIIYQQRLDEMGYTPGLLPLFSNISKAGTGETAQYNTIIPAFLQQHRQDYIIATLFGSFDIKSWNLTSLLDKFTYRFSNKRIVVTSLGKMPAGKDAWAALKYAYPQVIFLHLGGQEAGFISHWLQAYTDFGILATLPELAGKSGSFMAFKEHGVPVVCTAPSPSLQAYQVELDKALTVIEEGKPFIVPQQYAPVPVLDEVAAAFLQQLERGVF